MCSPWQCGGGCVFCTSCEYYAPIDRKDISRGVTNVEDLNLFHLQLACKILFLLGFELMSSWSGGKRCTKELASQLRLYGSRQASLQTLIGRFLRNHQSQNVSVTYFFRLLLLMIFIDRSSITVLFSWADLIFLEQVSNIFYIPDQHKSSSKDNVKLSRSSLLSNKIQYHKIV